MPDNQHPRSASPDAGFDFLGRPAQPFSRPADANGVMVEYPLMPIFGKALEISLTWFDSVVALLLAWGVYTGRKRGMSEELLDVMQWLTIVAFCALLYKPLGSKFSHFFRLPLGYSYVLGYLLVLILIRFVFGIAKRMLADRLVHADAFGGMEYYLGMLAGALRHACILLVVLAVLHARHINAAEQQAAARAQAENFGSITFPTFASVQQSIFLNSVSGRWVRQNLDEQLIEPVKPVRVIRL